MASFIFLIFFHLFCSVSAQDDVIKIIRSEGYIAELHKIITEDGYILNVHRIRPRQSTIKIVLIMHGLQVNSFAYVFMGRHNSLALQLADNGYDVWMGNARGTEFSKNHKTLNSNSPDFWDFSFHEIGNYDLSATIDQILITTNQSALHYVGNSQGTTAIMALLALKPKYNKNILTLHLMTPVVFVKNIMPLLKRIAKLSDVIEVDTMGMPWEIFGVDNNTRKMVASMCNLNSRVTYYICKAFLLLNGWNPKQWNDELFINTTKILEHIPNSISLRQILHYIQLYSDMKGRFLQFDYNVAKNLLLYNQTEPPEYNLKNVDAKIHFLYGTNDLIANYRDVEELIKYFKPMVIRIDKLIGWSHYDFLIAKDVKRMVNQKIIKLMNQYALVP